MLNINDLYKTIISEFVKLNAPEPNTILPQSLPTFIAAGQHGSVLTNEIIEAAISDVAAWSLDQTPALKSRHTTKEWSALVRKAFGPAIVEIDFDAADAASYLRTLVEKALNEKPAILDSQFTTMGGTLFYQPIIQAISIGPVIFEPKQEWLARSVTVGHIDNDSKLRLEKAFDGEVVPPSDNDIASIIENSIINVLAGSQIACTVETNGLAPELAQRRAITAARLAQTSIALLWQLYPVH
jgi:hypothetical protein